MPIIIMLFFPHKDINLLDMFFENDKTLIVPIVLVTAYRIGLCKVIPFKSTLPFIKAMMDVNKNERNI